MSRKVLVISSSLRRGSNSEMLADEFLKGAASAGHSAEKLGLAGKTINFCIGCLACQQTKRCVIDDDSREITEKMLNADVIAFATPVYYYSVCGQLKTVLDRANPLFVSDYKFRDIYLLAAAAVNKQDPFAEFQKFFRQMLQLIFAEIYFVGIVQNKVVHRQFLLIIAFPLHTLLLKPDAPLCRLRH